MIVNIKEISPYFLLISSTNILDCSSLSFWVNVVPGGKFRSIHGFLRVNK